jgi:hypothetical protein
LVVTEQLRETRDVRLLRPWRSAREGGRDLVAFPKRVSKADVIVVTARAGPISHDQTLSVDVPEGLTDHQASILLKVALPSLVATGGAACYLDSDQIAVSSDVDQVFSLYPPRVTFAVDHRRLDEFSRYGVRCGCPAALCGCLRRAVFEQFDVRIADPNGLIGMVVFFSSPIAPSISLLTGATIRCSLSRIPFGRCAIRAPWGRRRAASVLGRIRRCRRGSIASSTAFAGHPEERRAGLSVADYRIGVGYSFEDRPPPAFLHFINGGVGARGWKNWDDAEALLAALAPARGLLPC